jgi:hypothetical protein
MINYMDGSSLELWEILREVAGSLQMNARDLIVLKYLELTGTLYQSGKITKNDVQAAYDFGYRCSKDMASDKLKVEILPFLDMLNSYLGGSGTKGAVEQSGNLEDVTRAIMLPLREGKHAAAYEKCQELLGIYPDLAGDIYLYMSLIWSVLPCKGNEIERRAKYWVAVDCVNKAKSASNQLTEDYDKLIQIYRQNFPSAADAFMYDIIDGQSYTISCNGLRAVTTVRTK